jgi:hypothetical protein
MDYLAKEESKQCPAVRDTSILKLYLNIVRKILRES